MTKLAPGPRRLTQELVAGLGGVYRAVVSPTEPGLVAGTQFVVPPSTESAGHWQIVAAEGEQADSGLPLVLVEGTAWEISLAEDHVLGVLGFAGGIARRGAAIKAAAPDGLRVVCGGWKKLPASVKPVLRAGLDVAGVAHRLLDEDFVYVSKTQVALFGSVSAAVSAAVKLEYGPVSVQVTTVAEALEGADAGCRAVMVDTGRPSDLSDIGSAVRAGHDDVVVAYAGGVTEADLRHLRDLGADIVDIGRAVLDAPLWDLHLEVVR